MPDKGLDGMAAFRQLLKETKTRTSPPQAAPDQRNKLYVEYTILESYTKNDVLITPKENEVLYHADIQHFDSTGHLNTGTTVFHVNKIAIEQQGEEAVKAELNQLVATKFRALLELHKNS